MWLWRKGGGKVREEQTEMCNLEFWLKNYERKKSEKKYGPKKRLWHRSRTHKTHTDILSSVWQDDQSTPSLVSKHITCVEKHTKLSLFSSAVLWQHSYITCSFYGDNESLSPPTSILQLLVWKRDWSNIAVIAVTFLVAFMLIYSVSCLLVCSWHWTQEKKNKLSRLLVMGKPIAYFWLACLGKKKKKMHICTNFGAEMK